MAAAALTEPAPPASRGIAPKLAWVAALYFAEGFPFGLVTELFPIYLRFHGVSLAAIGSASAVGLPWTLKFLWAPLVDRLGTRARWVATCQLLMGLLVLVLAWRELHGAAPDAVLWVALLALATLSATQDIAVDAYSIELLTEREMGPANGVRVTAFRVAMIATGGLLVAVSGTVGWRGVFVAAGVVLLALAGTSSRLPSTRRQGTRREPLWEPVAELLRRPGAWAILLFVFAFKFGDYALIWMIKPFWVDRRFSAEEIGLIQGTVGIIATIVGALTGGVIVARWGTFRSLLALGVAQAAASLTYYGVAVSGAPRPAMYAASVIEHFTGGLGTAAFLTYLMSICERRFAATQYAVLTALFGLSRVLASKLSGNLAQSLGYPHFFLLTFALAVPAWLLLPAVRRTIRAPAPEPASP